MSKNLLSDQDLEKVVGGKKVEVVEVTMADTGEKGYMPLSTYKTMKILPDGRVQPPAGTKSDSYDFDFAPASDWKDVCATCAKKGIEFVIVKPR